MKNYNKILEAVNRGIQLALDDFEGEEQIQNIKSKQVYNRDYTKEYLDFVNEVVDLGLPSGTLWCKYNLGVNPNQLTKAEDWYGGYYAWGELEPNKTDENNESYFNWDNYKFGKEYRKLTKYCNDPEFGLNRFIDNLYKLLPEDDAAYQNKHIGNYKFHIPTKDRFDELLKYTKNYWVKNYNPNKLVHNRKDDKGIQGLNGRVFEGKNKNQLFIPATGYRGGSEIDEEGSHCYLWSSIFNMCAPNHAGDLHFDSRDIGMEYNHRCLGVSIRPIC